MANSNNELDGQVAIVTGGARGIGAEILRELSHKGAKVVALDLDQMQIDESLKSITGESLGIAVDITKPLEVKEAIDLVLSKFGRIDILVNNAGIALLDPLLEAKVEDWENTMNVNLRAPFLLARHFVPGMIERGKGKIINLSSQSGVNALDDHGAYCTSKGGLNMLTKVMASEWAKYNIQTNAICPNVILTPMGEKAWGDPKKGGAMKAKTPARRFGTPIEVADMVLYLASDASNYVCGEILMIDGGYTAI